MKNFCKMPSCGCGCIKSLRRRMKTCHGGMHIMENNNKRSSLSTFFIIIGAIVSIGAVLVMLYTFFKKYFKISFECDGDGDTECFDDEDFGDEEANYEPICCCEDHEEDSAASDADATEEEAF